MTVQYLEYFVMQREFGSHLYGTNTPSSDRDFKAIYVPNARGILLGRYAKTISVSTGSKDSKNTENDVDMETFSLDQYLKHLSEGQTVAVDMLFAPLSVDDHPIWKTIYENRHRILTKMSDAFIRYCRQQVNKYGFKGSRMQEVEDAINFITSTVPERSKVGEFASMIELFCIDKEHCKIVPIATPNGELNHFQVAGKKIPYTITGKQALDIVERVYREYGDRARAAKNNEGIDWKAVSHAVRVCRQGIDLARNGEIVFPLPYADEILDIKIGNRSFDEVSDYLVKLIDEMEDAMIKSDLREKPDQEWIDSFIENVYANVVLKHYE